MNALADSLSAHAVELAANAHDAMYRDPFWMARFGERGRRFSREDGVHHVNYLVEAIRTAHAAVLTDYARWIQSVLVTRGMCSLHLADNFARLAEAIRERGIADAQIAGQYLEQARTALVRRDDPARAIDLAVESLATRAASRLAGEGVPELACRLELRSLASYLADAVALRDPTLFAKHVEWSARTPAAHPDIPTASYPRLIGALTIACDDLPSLASIAAREVIAGSRSRAARA